MSRGTLTGVALGGIGGFNAHDAGVLKAAYDCGVTPDAITCTSGAIFWTYLYLTDPERIPAEVQRQAHRLEGFNSILISALGDPGVFRPAYIEYWARWLKPWRRLSIEELLDRLMPAQLYQPTRPAKEFEDMADAFNAARIPIFFNAYLVGAGRELAFCNPAAFDLAKPEHSRPHHILGREVTTEYRPIDGEAVRTALWLILYGFTHRYEGEVAIDGVYLRQLMLYELGDCDLVYAVKPQSSAWRGSPPANWFQVQDFTTEMWFNSSYAAEVAGLRARRDGIRIQPITMDRPLGFFNYFVERTRTYDEAYAQAARLFRKQAVRVP